MATKQAEQQGVDRWIRNGRIVVMRTCDERMQSRGNFQWPQSGDVEAPDWNGEACCGGGLHGLPWGEGDAWLLGWGGDMKWLAVEVDVKAGVVDLNGKIKFKRGTVLVVGTRGEVVDRIVEEGGDAELIIGGTATAGYAGTATAGYAGTATAGYAGTATAGYAGTATAGDAGTATAGDRGTATAGDRGTATAGDDGTATAGDRGTATAGDRGTATAGYAGTATAGDRGTATAGYDGTATAGDDGTLIIKRFNGKRWKYSIAYVGEDGIEANTPYRLDADGNFIKGDSRHGS